MEIPVIFEDANILVIDKPVGISVVEEDYEAPDTIREWVKNRYKLSNVAHTGLAEDEFEQRFGIVHRLDKETSGLLLIAKDKEVFKYLKGLFKFRRIKKEYQALVYGVVKDDRFEISAPILRNPHTGTSYDVDPNGREAITEFKVIKRFDKYTYLSVFPKTGRTHQIRVHLKALGYPIVNDKKYSNSALLNSSQELPSRMMLHAVKIKFIDWVGEERVYNSKIELSEIFKL